MIAKRLLVVIGTSGSTDYLRDDNIAAKRFWPVGLPMQSDNTCDGVHDEVLQYLCTRCFPDEGDLAKDDDDDDDAVHHDHDQEIE